MIYNFIVYELINHTNIARIIPNRILSEDDKIPYFLSFSSSFINQYNQSLIFS